MSAADLAAVLEQYRAGLESELILLVHLQKIAARQHEMTQSADIDALQRATDRRDTLTADLMKVEDQMRPLRDRLTRDQASAQQLPGFDHAVALYQTIARMVAEVLETDGHSVRALAQIVGARRAAVQDAEQAEATLAAYGRAAVRPRTATLVNRRG
ncbi:MAG: hypothetical protein ABJA98_08935 [Acidobacteriota bacterium]